MSNNTLAVIGVGNMAGSMLKWICGNAEISSFYLFDVNKNAYNPFWDRSGFYFTNSIAEATLNADYVLLSVKPQNYPEVLSEIKKVNGYSEKVYISIGAGITVDSVSNALDGAVVVRALPNLPVSIGKGVSAICRNERASTEAMTLIRSMFGAFGSVIDIDECEMNRIIGVTSSSPAYVFKFINAICKGAEAQGLDGRALLRDVCQMVIGSAELLMNSEYTPEELIIKVASKGGTTEQALIKLDEGNFEETVKNAMIACTARADELGRN